MTPAITPTFTPQPTPIPWTLENSISKLPEVYTNAIDKEVVDLYKSLIADLDEKTQKWITGMGLGLEDQKLDEDEIDLFSLLKEKDFVTSLYIVTNKTILDGISKKDVEWARNQSVENIESILVKDLNILLDKGMIGVGNNNLQQFITMTENDFNFEKGLFLISSLGNPDQSFFKYRVPDFNTQLYVLMQLLNSGIPKGYEIVALGTAICYGSLYSFVEEEIKQDVIEYAIDNLRYIYETDLLLEENGKVEWLAKDLPLEGAIYLTWGAAGKHYPWTDSKGWWDGWELFAQRPMQRWEFEWLFVDLSTLGQMRTWLIDRGFLDHSIEKDISLDNDFNNPHKYKADYDQEIDRVMAYLADYFYIGNVSDGKDFDSSHFSYQYDHELVDIDGLEIYNSKISNPDWQWNHFSDFGKIMGVCVDNAYMEAIIAKSLNICTNSLTRINESEIGHVFPSYINPIDEVWKTSLYDSIRLEELTDSNFQSPFTYSSCQIPISSDSVKERVYFGLLANSSDYSIQRKGIPLGYVFRRSSYLKQPGT